MSRIRAAAILITLVAVASSSLKAAGPSPMSGAKLTFRLDSANPSIRSDAPFAIDYNLTSSFEEVLNGELDFAFLEDNVLVLRLHGDPIVVPNGKTSFRLTLPSLEARRNVAAFAVRVAMHSTKGTFDLGTHDLLVPLRGKRQFVIGTPSLGRQPIAQLANRLRLDNYRSDAATLKRGDLVTVPAEIEVRDLPAQAIALYPFDLLVLAEEGFNRLSARQLDAIEDWIEQGGRAVIVPTGVLTPAHRLLLQKIASGAPDAPSFALNQFGRLEGEPTGGKTSIVPCRYGFGRALILRTMPASKPDGRFRDIDEPAWIRAVCFVWNVRNEQTEAILKAGGWISPPVPDYGAGTSPLQTTEFVRAKGLREMLFPRAVRVMPFGVVVTILALFLLAVAPGDYFLHGFLRRRWISWIAFPAMCLLFTAATVWIAEGYSGRADHRTELVIVDVGVDGKPRRASRIEHVVTAETRPLSSDIHNGIFAVTDVQPAAPYTPNTRFTPTKSAVGDAFDEFERRPPSFEGSVPSRFTVTRLSRQWSPSMHRATGPGADITVPTIAWSDLDSLDLTAASGRAALLEILHRDVPDCEVLLQNASRQFVSLGDNSSALQEKTPVGWADVMLALGRQARSGLFSIVSHVAPNGAGNLEDLAVADPQQPDEWLLQIATRQGENLTVYRRMLRRKSPATTEHSR